MALAERVKQPRTEHHWSQGDLAQGIDALVTKTRLKSLASGVS